MSAALVGKINDPLKAAQEIPKSASQTMRVRHLLKELAIMRPFVPLVCLFLFPLAAAAEPAKRPNILVLFSDDQRADTIAALGNPHLRTPHLDGLVRDGTAMTRAYCMGSMQGAVCVPSRAMLLTGRTLFRIKENLQGQATWPEAFATAGYRTFFTGKWHNGAPSAIRAFQESQAIFLGGMTDPNKAPVQDLGANRTLTDKRPSGKHSVELFADRAVDFLGRTTPDRPFLAYVAFNLPHDPRVAPKEYHARYDPARVPLPANFLPQHPFNNGEMIVRDEKLAPWPRTPEVVRQHLADYYAAIEFLDAQIGRILDALRKSGQYDQTLIVFASDSGLAIGSHGLFGKQSVYEHSMRAPLLLAGPGIPKNKRLDAFCYLLDVFPTLGELAGVAGPEGSEGKSLVPVFAGKQETLRTSVFTAYRNVQRAVREDRWKLIVYPHINKTQLFDLKADPHETKDLAGKPEHEEEIRRLTTLLKRWQGDLGDKQVLRSEKPLPEAFDFGAGKPK